VLIPSLVGKFRSPTRRALRSVGMPPQSQPVEGSYTNVLVLGMLEYEAIQRDNGTRKFSLPYHSSNDRGNLTPPQTV
jgi:hypothetical protein